MELTQEEIKWVKDKFSQEKVVENAGKINELIEKARNDVAKKYQPELDRLARENKISERKALVESMVAEADLEESKITSNKI